MPACSCVAMHMCALLFGLYGNTNLHVLYMHRVVRRSVRCLWLWFWLDQGPVYIYFMGFHAFFIGNKTSSAPISVVCFSVASFFVCCSCELKLIVYVVKGILRGLLQAVRHVNNNSTEVCDKYYFTVD